MKLIPNEFQTNANSCGVHKFVQLRTATKENGKHVYLYKREKLDGGLFGFEVFIPSITRAGTIQKFPNGVTRTIEEDTENYPGASVFGLSAFFCSTLERANERFEEMVKAGQEPEAEEQETESVSAEPKTRTRSKTERKLNLPEGEFSVTELAEANAVQYPIAFLWLKEQEAAGIVKFSREERRAAKGKPTRLFKKATV